MARRKSRIATIKCATDLKTISRIAESSGLVAESSTREDEFHVAHSGRIPASELRSALWASRVSKLDQAVRARTIPHWSIDLGMNTGLMAALVVPSVN